MNKMRRFKVKYYQLAHLNKEDIDKMLEIEEVIEDEVEADHFNLIDGMVVFNINTLKSGNIACFSRVISVKEIKENK